MELYSISGGKINPAEIISPNDEDDRLHIDLATYTGLTAIVLSSKAKWHTFPRIIRFSCSYLQRLYDIDPGGEFNDEVQKAAKKSWIYLSENCESCIPLNNEESVVDKNESMFDLMFEEYELELERTLELLNSFYIQAFVDYTNGDTLSETLQYHFSKLYPSKELDSVVPATMFKELKNAPDILSGFSIGKIYFDDIAYNVPINLPQIDTNN